MFRFLISAAALLLVASEAFAHGHESSAPPPPPKQDASTVPITLGRTKKGMVFTTLKGMTLYYFDRDDTGKTSNCNDKCTEKWIPLQAVKDAQPFGDFTVIVRNDGSKMWAYRYRPLYTSNDDKAPGDINGSDPQNLWHIARPAN
jgi:predicted lipoprotein with Yx(FWY)xxD motif